MPLPLVWPLVPWTQLSDRRSLEVLSCSRNTVNTQIIASCWPSCRLARCDWAAVKIWKLIQDGVFDKDSLCPQRWNPRLHRNPPITVYSFSLTAGIISDDFACMMSPKIKIRTAETKHSFPLIFFPMTTFSSPFLPLYQLLLSWYAGQHTGRHIFFIQHQKGLKKKKKFNFLSSCKTFGITFDKGISNFSWSSMNEFSGWILNPIWVDTLGWFLKIQKFAFRSLSCVLPLVVLGCPWSPTECESEGNMMCAEFGHRGSYLVLSIFNSQSSGTGN